jgi:hypothetical protein
MEDDDEDAYRERAMALCVRCYSADAAATAAAAAAAANAAAATAAATAAHHPVTHCHRCSLAADPVVPRRRYKAGGGRQETAAAARQLTGGKKRDGGKKKETTKDDVRTMFDEIDDDGSGLLDRGETKVLMVQLFPGLSDEEFDVAFAKMDDDGSGEVDFDEFATWWKAELKEKGAELEARMRDVREKMKMKRMAMQLYNADPGDDVSKLRANLANRATKVKKQTKEQVRLAAAGLAPPSPTRAYSRPQARQLTATSVFVYRVALRPATDPCPITAAVRARAGRGRARDRQ